MIVIITRTTPYSVPYNEKNPYPRALCLHGLTNTTRKQPISTRDCRDKSRLATSQLWIITITALNRNGSASSTGPWQQDEDVPLPRVSILGNPSYN